MPGLSYPPGEGCPKGGVGILTVVVSVTPANAGVPLYEANWAQKRGSGFRGNDSLDLPIR
jgi:hypothetical protein